MTTRPIDHLVQIAANGGGLDLDARNLSKDQLIQLARNTNAKATLILRGVGSKSTDELVQISRNTTGNVIFVLD
jgi:hypothetical protein